MKFMKSAAFIFFFSVATMLVLTGCTKEQGEEFAKNVQKTVEAKIRQKEMAETRVIALMYGNDLFSSQASGSGDDTGMHKLLKLLEDSAPSHITVVGKVFNSDAEGEAVDFLNQKVKSVEENPEKTEIILIGHSMGGYGIVNVANDLNDANTTVNKMVQVDPLHFRSATEACQPLNVGVGLTYFQQTDPAFPDGEWCESDDAIDIDVELHFPESDDIDCWDHVGMDDCPPLHQEVKSFVFDGTIPTGLGISPLP